VATGGVTEDGRATSTLDRPIRCSAAFLNRNLSGYLVPTNADIPKLDILFVGDFDEEARPLGTRGMGELTAVSVAPAIANAVYHATGMRVRRLPISVENLL